MLTPELNLKFCPHGACVHAVRDFQLPQKPTNPPVTLLLPEKG